MMCEVIHLRVHGSACENLYLNGTKHSVSVLIHLKCWHRTFTAENDGPGFNQRRKTELITLCFFD